MADCALFRCGLICFIIFLQKAKKFLDKWRGFRYNKEAVWETTNAAIAQQVERILGKDEVSSSNLDSSSKKHIHWQSQWMCFLHSFRLKLGTSSAPVKQEYNLRSVGVPAEQAPPGTGTQFESG